MWVETVSMSDECRQRLDKLGHFVLSLIRNMNGCGKADRPQTGEAFSCLRQNIKMCQFLFHFEHQCALKTPFHGNSRHHNRQSCSTENFISL